MRQENDKNADSALVRAVKQHTARMEKARSALKLSLSHFICAKFANHAMIDRSSIQS